MWAHDSHGLPSTLSSVITRPCLLLHHVCGVLMVNLVRTKTSFIESEQYCFGFGMLTKRRVGARVGTASLWRKGKRAS